jgi:hypothetical protein
VLGILAIFGIMVPLLLGGEYHFATPAFRPLSFGAFFLPFGPLLFALSGRPAIPSVVAEYREAKAEGKPFSLTGAIAWGTIVPALVYFLFVAGVLWLSPVISEDSLSGLAGLPAALLALMGVLGLITIWTSYFMIGLNAKDILRLDLKFPRFLAGATVVILPFLVYILGFQHFLAAVSFTGGVFLGLEGIFVIAMWRSAFPAHPARPWTALLYVVFAAALAYAIIAAF